MVHELVFHMSIQELILHKDFLQYQIKYCVWFVVHSYYQFSDLHGDYWSVDSLILDLRAV